MSIELWLHGMGLWYRVAFVFLAVLPGRNLTFGTWVLISVPKKLSLGAVSLLPLVCDVFLSPLSLRGPACRGLEQGYGAVLA